MESTPFPVSLYPSSAYQLNQIFTRRSLPWSPFLSTWIYQKVEENQTLDILLEKVSSKRKRDRKQDIGDTGLTMQSASSQEDLMPTRLEQGSRNHSYPGNHVGLAPNRKD